MYTTPSSDLWASGKEVPGAIDTDKTATTTYNKGVAEGTVAQSMSFTK